MRQTRLAGVKRMNETGKRCMFHVAQGNFPGEPSCVFHVEYKPECFLDCPFCHCWPTFNMRLIALRTRSLDRIPDCYVIPNNWNHSRIRGYLSCVFARMFNLTYSSKEGLQMVYTTWSPKIEKLHYRGWYWKKKLRSLEKKFTFPGKKIYSPWKRNLGSSGLWSCGPLVLWSSGPVVLWSCGFLVLWSCSSPVVLWSCGPLVFWSCGPLVLWSFGPVVLVLWSCSALALWSRGRLAKAWK